MNEQIKVYFIGGLTNGKIVFDYLKVNKYVDLVGVITYPDSFKGARHVVFDDDEYIIKSGKTKGYEHNIKDAEPDLIVVAGWSELISDAILDTPKMGVIGFHPAKLPMDRGRSVLAWQIEDGYTETALTMFKYTDYPDGGDIIGQDIIKIEKEDYISDILDKVDIATENLMKAYFPLLRQGLAKPKKQDLSEGSFRRLRNAGNSVINWNSNSETIYNKVRAISHPYPGATTTLIINGDECNMLVWRSEIVEDFPYGKEAKPSTVVAKLYDSSLIVKTRDAFLRITDFEIINA